MDANDLPTGTMSDGIRENVYDILHIKTVMRAAKQEATEAAVMH